MEDRTTASSAPDAVREQAIAWLARLRSDPTDTDRTDFENWYVADPRHAEIYDAVLNAWDETALAARTPAARHRHAGRRHSPAKVAGVAAAVLLLFMAGSFALTHHAWRGPAPETLLASRVGQIRTIVLDDGSRVTLDTDSVVHVNFDDDQRRLQLERGRARFEAAHDVRRHRAAEPVRGLVEHHVAPGEREPARDDEPGDAAADDGDVRHRHGPPRRCA